MNSQFRLPSKRELWTVTGFTVLFLSLTAFFTGLRIEHIGMTLLFLLLFFAGEQTRKLAVGLLPFILFGISYDWMRIYPNFRVNPVDIEQLYNLEKNLFGIYDNGQLLTPCEYFAIHHWPLADFFAGLFYLCWVPVPIAFGLWLYFTGKRTLYLRFAMVFLFVNLIGFVGYYIHPAAPPWYAINHGFQVVFDMPGNVAGLGRFDQMIGFALFDSIYGRNANVFAAVPSLHAAYMLVALAYAVFNKCSRWIIALFASIMVGIWCTAVYTSHHYIIDVLLGIGCALTGILFFEKILLQWRPFRSFFEQYRNYIA